MNYPGRISLALSAACIIVFATIASLPRVLREIDAVAVLAPTERPIHFDLSSTPPPKSVPQDPPKRLVDAGAPAEAPVKDTDLISSQASQAQDMSEKTGDPNRPAASVVDEFEQLSTPPPSLAAGPTEQRPSPPAEPASTQPSAEVSEPVSPPAAPEKPAPASLPEKKEPGVAVASEPKAAEPEAKDPPKPDAPKPEEKKLKETLAKQSPAESPKPESFKVAAAQPAPQAATEELRAERGREGGGADKSGPTSFEANKHVLGEYMLKVRSRVEREWRTALHLRYSGAARTAAVIHCVIRPDGTIESVSIAEPGDSLTYAVLCRDAVERAGPFGPFPFDVPEIYRTENLEINWKFSYL